MPCPRATAAMPGATNGRSTSPATSMRREATRPEGNAHSLTNTEEKPKVRVPAPRKQEREGSALQLVPA